MKYKIAFYLFSVLLLTNLIHSSQEPEFRWGNIKQHGGEKVLGLTHAAHSFCFKVIENKAKEDSAAGKKSDDQEICEEIKSKYSDLATLLVVNDARLDDSSLKNIVDYYHRTYDDMTNNSQKSKSVDGSLIPIFFVACNGVLMPKIDMKPGLQVPPINSLIQVTPVLVGDKIIVVPSDLLSANRPPVLLASSLLSTAKKAY